MMISKEQFLAIKRCQSEGMSMAAAAKQIGISVQTARKWAKLDEVGFDALKRADIPYMDQYREFILSFLRVCSQTRETNILYRLSEEFPDFNCNKRIFYRYMHILREQNGLGMQQPNPQR